MPGTPNMSEVGQEEGGKCTWLFTGPQRCAAGIVRLLAHALLDSLRPSQAARGERHMGHFWCRQSQVSAHRVWNTWLQPFNSRTSSPRVHSQRQMAQAPILRGPAPLAASAVDSRRRGIRHSAACKRARAAEVWAAAAAWERPSTAASKLQALLPSSRGAPPADPRHPAGKRAPARPRLAAPGPPESRPAGRRRWQSGPQSQAMRLSSAQTGPISPQTALHHGGWQQALLMEAQRTNGAGADAWGYQSAGYKAAGNAGSPSVSAV